jgi:8-oxo-dGTP pyrophosphatase MutT (NUDIX family)
MIPRTVKRRERTLSPWVRLVERTVSDGTNEAVYHSFAQADYVCIVAVTPQNELVCVRQYRPAVDAVTLEMPAGLLEPNEDPVGCAVRELAEEARFRPSVPPTLLGCFMPDTGRLENRFWAYVAREVMPISNAVAEPNLTRQLVPLGDVPRLIVEGRFAHALHIAALSLAMMRGSLPMLLEAWRSDGTAGTDQSKVLRE